MAHRNLTASKNLDVRETSHDQVDQAAKGSAGDLAPDTLLSVVCSSPEQREEQPQRQYRPDGSKYLTLYQATNIIEAVDYAKKIGCHLVAHVTIHWSGTVVFDDHDSKRFAKVREGFHKYLLRRRVSCGLAGVWCRECKAHTDIVHCHLLFHLPVEDRTGARLLQIESALFRLVGRHGEGILGEFAVKLKIWADPDGLYLIKGGDREVWDRFRIRKEWRKSQGMIHGKRCGTTVNIGRSARRHALAADNKQRGAE